MAQDNVNINMSTIDNSTRTLDKIIEKLDEIQKKSTLELGKEDKKSRASMDNFSKSIHEYNSKIKESSKLNTENKNSLNQLESQAKSSGEAVNDLAGAYIALRAAKAFMSEIKRDIRLLADIDQSLFNLGVVAGKTTTEIEKMKIDFLALGATIPISAIKLADATDILARSGLEYIDAIQTMRAGAELAVAAGEDIADVSRIKIMFSLNSSNCWKPLRVA